MPGDVGDGDLARRRRFDRFPLTQYWGSWGAYIGAERLGAAVFPFGAGFQGQSLRTLQWMRQMQTSVFYGTASYALRLAEVATENEH